MMEGTKGGAQRAHNLRPRCIGEVVPGPRHQSTIYPSHAVVLVTNLELRTVNGLMCMPVTHLLTQLNLSEN
jgi:hypothetical protein